MMQQHAHCAFDKRTKRKKRKRKKGNKKEIRKEEEEEEPLTHSLSRSNSL